MWRLLAVGAVAALGVSAIAASVQMSAAQQGGASQTLEWVTQEFTPVSLRVIPSENMVPTLLVGDRAIMVRFEGPPKRGDIAIFRHPRSDRVFVKRVIGLPGDTVEMKGGQLVLNGELVLRTKMRTVSYRPDDLQLLVTATEYSEQLPGEDKPHLIHEWSDEDQLDETPVFKVPEGHVFMMGDNRDNSEDSRAPTGHRDLAEQSLDAWSNYGGGLPNDRRYDAIGFVPATNLMGRVATVMFSLNGCRLTAEQKATGAVCLAPRIGERL